MNTFWIGVIIAFIAMVITSLCSIISTENLIQKYRSFLIWFPFNVSIAFFSGFTSFVLISKNNEFGRGTITVLITIAIAVLAYILERNYFLLKKPWENLDKMNLKKFSIIVYFISNLIAVIPYLVFYDFTLVDRVLLLCLIGIPFLVFLFYWLTWDYIYFAVEKDIENKIHKTLENYTRFSFTLLEEDKKEPFFYMRLEKS
jgi:hypothetical protein